jgi:UDP-N-acetylglucosamine 2-epimerase (non-hydrolysing)
VQAVKTVLLVFGTRPEAIKMAPVVQRLKERSDRFRPVVAVTGQHREMLDQVLALYGITPDLDLALMRPGQRPEEVLAGAVTGIASLVREIEPDAVLVQGDTTTTLAGALAAFYEHVPVGHIEAGLRTDDKRAPFPEEVNRRLTTQVTDWHFAPTSLARDRLLAEGVRPADVYVTGNTVIDAVLEAVEMECTFDDERLAAFAEGATPFMLMTAHRRESWGEPMGQICLGVRDVLDAHPEMTLVFPVHRNPIVRDVVNPILGEHPRVVLVEPLDYLPFVKLMRAATLILSDSGGVQEEAPSLDTPVLVLRETTERPEAMETGAIDLVGVTREGIAGAAIRLLADEDAYRRMAEAANPFGDGTAASQIVDIVEERLNG